MGESAGARKNQHQPSSSVSKRVASVPHISSGRIVIGSAAIVAVGGHKVAIALPQDHKIGWWNSDGTTVQYLSSNGTTLTTDKAFSATQLTSTIANGTPPLVVTSLTQVDNLNVQYLGGFNWQTPGTIGSVTPSTGVFTALSATTFTGATITGTTFNTGSNTFTLSGAAFGTQAGMSR